MYDPFSLTYYIANKTGILRKLLVRFALFLNVYIQNNVPLFYKRAIAQGEWMTPNRCGTEHGKS